MRFGSTKKEIDASHAQKVTVLSLGFELTGDVISKNDIRADGVLRGNIRTDKKVVVGEKASIVGDIVADEISISGEVIGDLYINGDTTIHTTAKVSGNILTQKIFIHHGAEINSCIRTALEETIQKEKESLKFPSPSLKHNLPPLEKTPEHKAESKNVELISNRQEEPKRQKIEDKTPPISDNIPRSW